LLEYRPLDALEQQTLVADTNWNGDATFAVYGCPKGFLCNSTPCWSPEKDDGTQRAKSAKKEGATPAKGTPKANLHKTSLLRVAPPPLSHNMPRRAVLAAVRQRGRGS